jgi:hypothetical protein
MSSESVDEDNLHISNSGSNGNFLSKQSGDTGGLTWAAASSDLSGDSSPQLGGFLDANGNYIQMQKGGDISSASPTVIDTDGDYFAVTGTTNFSAFTVAADRHFFLEFGAVLTMTHGNGTLDLPGGANITTAASDVGEFFSTAANVVTCVNYTKRDGTSVVAAAGGKMVQVVHVADGALATGTTTAPWDDTIPQNTEGNEFITLAVTPTNASNILYIDWLMHTNCSIGGVHLTTALFQDSIASAIHATVEFQGTGGAENNAVFGRYKMVAGTTSSTTFKIRTGVQSAATMTFNGQLGSRKMGGKMLSNMTITEVEA